MTDLEALWPGRWVQVARRSSFDLVPGSSEPLGQGVRHRLARLGEARPHQLAEPPKLFIRDGGLIARFNP